MLLLLSFDHCGVEVTQFSYADVYPKVIDVYVTWMLCIIVYMR